MLKTPKNLANQRAVISPSRMTTNPVVSHKADETESVTTSVLGCVIPKAPPARRSIKES